MKKREVSEEEDYNDGEEEEDEDHHSREVVDHLKPPCYIRLSQCLNQPCTGFH